MCKNGHEAPKYPDGTCKECRRLKSLRFYERHRERIRERYRQKYRTSPQFKGGWKIPEEFELGVTPIVSAFSEEILPSGTVVLTRTIAA